jgi:hypothetical protein
MQNQTAVNVLHQLCGAGLFPCGNSVALICLEYRLEPACRGRIIRGMETTVGKLLIILLFVAATITAALTAGYTARFDLGFSPEQIRIQAIIVAIVIGLLLAIDHYGKKLRKPK